MQSDKRKIVSTVCIVLIALFLIFLMVQMSYMGKQECLFFDANGLPTLMFGICGVLFGAVFIVLGRNLNTEKKSFGKLCRIIGILEIISAVIQLLMSQILHSVI